MEQLDVFGSAIPADAVDWPNDLRRIAAAMLELDSRMSADEAGAIVHDEQGRHTPAERCAYCGRDGSEALRRLRARTGPAGEQTRSPRLTDNSPAGARARVHDPDTSHAAAATIAPKRLRDSQEAILRLFRELGPMDDGLLLERYEAAFVAGLRPGQSPSGIRTRRRELVDAGLVADSGRRAVLEGSGRRAIVWELTDAAVQGWTPGRIAGTLERDPRLDAKAERSYAGEPDL